eukprot:7359274-Prymnesium_polylepis.1
MDGAPARRSLWSPCVRHTHNPVARGPLARVRVSAHGRATARHATQSFCEPSALARCRGR